jgi:PIN domain nuclease of toxin-antitoxin system
MLVAQAQAERLTLLTSDNTVAHYSGTIVYIKP